MTSTRRSLMAFGVLVAMLAASAGIAQAQPSVPGSPLVATHGYGTLRITITPGSGAMATDTYDLRYEEQASGSDGGATTFAGETDTILPNVGSGTGTVVYDLGGLKHGTAYAIAARASRAGVKSPWSDVSGGDPFQGIVWNTLPAPDIGVVQGLMVEALDGGLKATWTAIADPIGTPIARYRVTITAGTTATGTYSNQMWVAGTMTEATVMNLTNGVEYTVTVRAQATGTDGNPDADRLGTAESASKKVTPMAGAGGTDPEPDPTPTPAVPLVGILALFAGLLAAGRARLRR